MSKFIDAETFKKLSPVEKQKVLEAEMNNAPKQPKISKTISEIFSDEEWIPFKANRQK
jgi:hypothetical protein